MLDSVRRCYGGGGRQAIPLAGRLCPFKGVVLPTLKEYILPRPSGYGRFAAGNAIVRAGRTPTKGMIVDKVTSLDKFRVPIGNQEIELQQMEYAAGGMPMLRIRIRERSRFTIFDIDPVTAERWAKSMAEWSAAQPR